MTTSRPMRKMMPATLPRNLNMSELLDAIVDVIASG